MKIPLTIEQLLMSIQQMMLIIKYEPAPSDIHRRWHRTAYNIEKENAARAFELASVFPLDPAEFHISTGAIYQCVDGWIERFVHEEQMRKKSENNEKFLADKNHLFANLIFLIAHENGLRPKGVRTIHFTYEGGGKLLYQTSVLEEMSPLQKTEYFLHDLLSEIVDYLRTPDQELPPCDASVTGSHQQFCILACPARFECVQRRQSFSRSHKNSK